MTCHCVGPVEQIYFVELTNRRPPPGWPACSTQEGPLPTATRASSRTVSTNRAGLADELLVMVTRLARRLRRLNDDGISPTQRSILTTLEKHGPLTHGDLADAERVRPPTITAAVDRLE